MSLCGIPSLSKTFLVILFFIVLSQIGVDLYLPAFAVISRSLHVSATWVKLSLTAYLIGYAVFQPFSGYWLDKIFYKKVLVYTCVFFIIGSVGCALSQNVIFLLAFRFLQGGCASSFIIAVKLLIKQQYSGSRLPTYSSIFSTLWCFIPIVAPVLGGYLVAHVAWQASFYLMALLGATGLVLLITKKKITRKQHNKKNWVKSKVLNNSSQSITCSALGLVLCGGAIYGALFAYLTLAPLIFLEKLNFTSIQFGWITIIVSAGYMLGSIGNGFLVRFYNIDFLMKGALFFAFIINLVAVLLLKDTGVSLMMAVMFATIFFAGFIFPNCNAIILLSFKKSTGLVAGCIGAGQLILCGLTSLVVSTLPDTLTLLGLSVFILVALSALGYALYCYMHI